MIEMTAPTNKTKEIFRVSKEIEKKIGHTQTLLSSLMDQLYDLNDAAESDRKDGESSYLLFKVECISERMENLFDLTDELLSETMQKQHAFTRSLREDIQQQRNADNQ
jgi:hypothetical protein